MCFGAEAAPVPGRAVPRVPRRPSRGPGGARLAVLAARLRCSRRSGGGSVLAATSRRTTCSGRWRRSSRTPAGATLIVTGDRDMYQCVSDCGLGPVPEVRDHAALPRSTRPRCERRYGVGPELVPDFIALRGDPSDGLPGAPGIGPKTAASLLVEVRVARGRDCRRFRREAAGGRCVDGIGYGVARVPGHRDAADGLRRPAGGPGDGPGRRGRGGAGARAAAAGRSGSTTPETSASCRRRQPRSRHIPTLAPP